MKLVQTWVDNPTYTKSYPAKTLAGLPVMRKPVKKTFADILGITCYTRI